MQKLIAFGREVFQHFSKSNTFQEGAALAYYTVFSLLPMLIIVVSIFGMIWGKAAVSGELYEGLVSTLGETSAQGIEQIIKQQHQNHTSVWTAIIGFVTLALGASGMFNQLHTAFNNIWGLESPQRNGLLNYLIKHASSFVLLIITFFLLFLSVTIHSYLVRYGDVLPDHFQLTLLAEHLVSFFLVSLIFAILFKVLGDAIVHWKIALFGGLFTALLFIIGKFAIGMYIGHSKISTTFGSASVLALVMVWVYYTSQMLFLGASFVYVLGKRLGQEIAAVS